MNSWLTVSSDFSLSWIHLWAITWMCHLVVLTRTCKPGDIFKEGFLPCGPDKWTTFPATVVGWFSAALHITFGFTSSAFLYHFGEKNPSISPEECGLVMAYTVIVCGVSYVLTNKE